MSLAISFSSLTLLVECTDSLVDNFSNLLDVPGTSTPRRWDDVILWTSQPTVAKMGNTPMLPEVHVDLPQESNWYWSDITVAVMQLYQKITMFTPPPPDTCLDDLIAVRQAFNVIDDLDEPIKAAALGFANMVAGETRRKELHELLLKMIVPAEQQHTKELEMSIYAGTRTRGDMDHGYRIPGEQ
jgi:hypothetical protein